jgi:hypothetical protein
MTSRFGPLGGFLLVGSVMLSAQSPPPVQGTMALEGTTDKVYAALHVLIIKTMDGVEHMIHYAKDLVVHGGKASGTDGLEGLEKGSSVVVHYTIADSEETAQEVDRVGGAGLKTTEGTVVRIDRRHMRITISYANGRQETLRLTERAAGEALRELEEASGLGGATKVIVYYSEEAGHKVAHYFKAVS